MNFFTMARLNGSSSYKAPRNRRTAGRHAAVVHAADRPNPTPEFALLTGDTTRAGVSWPLGEVSPNVWLGADLSVRLPRPIVHIATQGVVVRSISRVVPVIIAGVVSVFAGVGIGVLAASHGSVGTSRGPATTSIASSAQWAAEGAQLARESGRHWAYESLPIDVTASGTYFFDFGPVPTSFDNPSHPRGIAFDWPPDSRFSVAGANAPPRTVTLRGKRYFQIGMSIFHFSSPYRGYRAWIY